ncbi:MAG TPA: sodium:calcium antiporter [Anaerolineae bacterium]|nr:sodium:calcium antiporter [Anaerolineae bacterium]
MITAFLSTQVPFVNGVVGIIALALLVLSSNLAVKKLVGVAMYFKLSATFMGMTIFSLATSIPEITSHLVASVGILRGKMDYQIGSAIVLGANIGSDVVQQTLIMGIVVAFTGILYFRRYFLWKSMIPMIGTTIMCLILGWDGIYSRLDGFILFGTFIAYTYYLYWDERKHYQKTEEEDHVDVPENLRQVVRDALIACVAMVFTIAGAQLVLSITEMIVTVTGVGGSLIGVVTLGVASALPELTTALSGIKHKAHGVSIGTLVGSNITNPLVAIGGGALLSTYWVPRPLLYWDLPWETVTGMILWAILWFTKGKLGKWGAVYLIGLYAVYVTLRMAFFAVD